MNNNCLLPQSGTPIKKIVSINKVYEIDQFGIPQFPLSSVLIKQATSQSIIKKMFGCW